MKIFKDILFLLLILSSSLVSAQVKIVAVGDIMLGTAYPDPNDLPSKGNNHLLDSLSSYLSDGNVTFGNLEGALTDNLSQPKNCGGICYFFGMPTRYGKALKKAGFDVVSIANNHSSDFGAIGRKSTKQTLDTLGIKYAGTLDCETSIFTIDSIKYGFCAFAPNSQTVKITNIPYAEKIVHQLADSVDIVIVSFHGGAEGPTMQHITRKTEVYVGENRGNVYEFAHRMIDAGADVLLGHGPHVTRAVEVYKDRFIAYSMGNFCTYNNVSVKGVNGLAPIFQIYTDSTGVFDKAQIIPTYQTKHQAPKIDKYNRVIHIIQNLTKTDFPEMSNVITILDDGWITKKTTSKTPSLEENETSKN